MQIKVLVTNHPNTECLDEYDSLLKLEFGRYAPKIESICVTCEDQIINDKFSGTECCIEVTLYAGQCLPTKALSENPHMALVAACKRAKRLLDRHLKRAMQI